MLLSNEKAIIYKVLKRQASFLALHVRMVCVAFLITGILTARITLAIISKSRYGFSFSFRAFKALSK